MSKIVVYQSSTGFTRKYANWIAEELGCEAKEYKSVKPSELAEYDMVIYGGWLMANMVYGYNKIKALNLKNVVVFADGMSVPSQEFTDKLAEQNQISRDRLFYFEGGYNPKGISFVKRIMMNMIKKSLQKKADKTPDDIHMLETFEGADNTHREAIRELIEFCK